MFTQVGFTIAFPILTVIADVSWSVRSLTATFIPVHFVHTFAIVLTGVGRAFVDVNLTVIVHDVIIVTAARHAAVDVNIRSHELTQLIDEFSGPCEFTRVSIIPAL